LIGNSLFSGAIRPHGNRIDQPPTSLGVAHLGFLEHVHQLNALKGDSSRGEGLKHKHRPNDPLYGVIDGVVSPKAQKILSSPIQVCLDDIGE
jgi:hypothetical protein